MENPSVTASWQSRQQMAPAYEPADVEARWYAEWVRRGYFRAMPNSGKEPFCIVLPPPNVTGSLHIGHAFQQLLQDIVIRRKRMQGYEALWLPGTDHAGIATQVVVERELAKEGIDRRQIGREAFVERVWQWKEQYGGRIVEQMKAIGNSCDWDRLRFTMDPGLARAVRVAFVKLYDEGLIYRGERLVNWCPRDTTALSDSELEYWDVDGELVTFRYDLTDGAGHIDCATTRVETILGDTGVAVHPDDERYRELVGKTVRHMFDGREIPIVADHAVDPTFGTGAVKVTPAHDPTDFEIGQRHGLPLLNILTAEARVSDAAPEEFRGLDRSAARAAVLERLREMGRVVDEQRPYVHPVGHCYRCETEIEHWLSGQQWFVAVDRLKGPAKEAALDGRIRFWPERWIHAYTQWLDGLRDWNISRQLWWGHRIPVWYCSNGHQFAAVEDPPACPDCRSQEIEQDPDVLDTWFSSQLWPFSTLGWPEETEDLRFFYPTSALITGYEILYLWVARMIMSGLHLADDVPFRHAVIHGLVRDPQGRKMSKSLGNVIDPMDAIQKAGADALRFGLTWQATDAQNIPFGEEHIDAGRRFANKIWNAARLVLSEYPGGPPELPAADRLTLPERWLLSRHQACLEEVDGALDAYRFADAAQAVHRFLWSEFCDWGLEMSKGRLRSGDESERRDAANLLAWLLERTLRILHPIMPFVTEEVWQRIGTGGQSVVVAPWPEPHSEHRDAGAEADFASIQELVDRIRRVRGLADVPPKHATVLKIRELPEHDRALVAALRGDIERLAGLRGIEDEAEGPRVGVTIWLKPGARVELELEPVTVKRALDKAMREVDELELEAQAMTRRLSSDGFLTGAPEDVVAEARRRLDAAKVRKAMLLADLEGFD